MGLDRKNAYTISLVATKQLVGVLKIAASLAPKRPSQHILEFVRVSFSRDEVTVEATDLGAYYRATVFMPNLDVIQPFSVLLSRESIKVLKAGLQLRFNEMFYEFDGISYPVMQDALEYPHFPVLQQPHSAQVEAQYFEDFAACAVSAANTEIRPILTGVCHRYGAMFATDGLRLFVTNQATCFESDIVVPAYYAKLLSKVFGKAGALIEYDGTYVQYRSDDAEITLKLIDGHYPDVSRIIPSQAMYEVAIENHDAWISACNKALALHKQAHKSSRDSNFSLFIDFDTDGVTASAKSAAGEMSQVLQLLTDNWGMTVTVNAQYLKDALQQVGNRAQLNINANDKPFSLISGDGRRKAVVSPISFRG